MTENMLRLQMLVKMLWNFVLVIPSIIVGILLIWGTLLKRAIFGEMTKIEGCKLNGKKVSLIKFMKALNKEGKPFVLDTDKGKIVVCHGQPNGRFVLDPNDLFANNNATYKQLIEALNLEPGEYGLLSCFNGKREDYIKDGYKIRRIEGTLTPYPTVASMVGGTLRVSADRWFLKCMIQLGCPMWKWGIVDSAIKEIENVPVSPSDDAAEIGITGVERHIVTDPETIQKLNKLKEEGRFHF